MDWKNVGQAIAKAAPLVGAVVGGPVGAVAGAAATLVASCLGVEATPEAIMGALTPEGLVKIRELEATERGRFLDWQADMVRLDLANVQGARRREIEMAKAGMGFSAWGPPALISAIVTVGFFLILRQLFTYGSKELGDGGMLLLGSLSTAFGAVVNYYLGSSLGSTLKTFQQPQGGK